MFARTGSPLISAPFNGKTHCSVYGLVSVSCSKDVSRTSTVLLPGSSWVDITNSSSVLRRFPI